MKSRCNVTLNLMLLNCENLYVTLPPKTSPGHVLVFGASAPIEGGNVSRAVMPRWLELQPRGKVSPASLEKGHGARAVLCPVIAHVLAAPASIQRGLSYYLFANLRALGGVDQRKLVAGLVQSFAGACEDCAVLSGHRLCTG